MIMKFLVWTVIDNAKPYPVSFRQMLQIRIWSLSDVCYTISDWPIFAKFGLENDYVMPDMPDFPHRPPS
jgi:hypothetical protein